MKKFREWSSIPVVVLTARGQEEDKIRALDAGADDYVTKPFSMGELLARMRVALRHRARIETGEELTAVETGPLRIDLEKRVVKVSREEVRLTPIEYRLLATLARYAGRVLTHDFLLREVWGPGYTSQHHYLRVYMAQLRHKIESDPARPRLLITEPGRGLSAEIGLRRPRAGRYPGYPRASIRLRPGASNVERAGRGSRRPRRPLR